MTRHPNQRPTLETKLPVYHPKPVIHTTFPGSTSIIPGRSSIVPLPQFVSHASHPVQLAGQIGHLGVQLRGPAHTSSSESTRAHLYAQAVIAEIPQELGRIPGRSTLSTRVKSLQNDLDRALRAMGR